MKRTIGLGFGIGFNFRPKYPPSGGTPTPAPAYLGNVATKVRIPTNTSTTNKQFNSRSHHFARDAITELKIALPNWYWARATTRLETNPAGAVTYSAAIEYPAGVFTQVLFGGATTKSVASGATELSDFVAVSIPANEAFWVRIFATSSSSIVFLDGLASPASDQVDDANGEAMEFAASGLTDKTMGGTITATTGAVGAPGFGPCAIVAMTVVPTVYLHGDSRAWGYLDVYGVSGNADGDLGESAKSIGPSYGYINAAGSGDGYLLWNVSNDKRLALARYCSHVIMQTGINDLRSGGSNRTAAALLNDRAVARGLFRTVNPDIKFFGTTVAPNTTSSDSWATTANQTVNANNAEIQTYNAAIRAGVSGETGFFDVASSLESGTTGKWLAPGYTPDGLHASPTVGYPAVKTAAVINPALITRPPITPPSIPAFEAETTALLARMSSPPDVASDYAVAIDQLYKSLKTGAISGSNILAKLELLYVLFADDSQKALLNWASSSNNLTVVGSCTFNAWSGYTFGGTTNDYLGSGINWNALTKFLQNDASLGIWTSQALGTGAPGIGKVSAGGGADIIAVGSTTILVRANSSGGANQADTPADTLWTGVRASSASQVYYRGAAAKATTVEASAAREASNLAIGQAGNTTHRFAFAGAALTANEVADVYFALNAFRQSLP